MECGGKVWIVYGARGTEITIWNLSDIHWLSKACVEQQVFADIERIKKDPCAFWFGGGDYAEFIGYDDGKRFDPDCVSDRVSVSDLGMLGKRSVQGVRDLFWGIKEKCIGLLLGNHEKQFQKRHMQDDLHAWLCTELGVPNLQYSAFQDIVFTRTTGCKTPRLERTAPSRNGANARISKRFFLHHGAGYAQTPGGKLNRLIQFMDSFEADVYMIGHVHDKMGRRQPYLTADENCSKILQREKVGVISGSYYATYQQGTTTYGEQRGYRPTTLGASWVRYKPATDKLSAEI